jgi:hypothetical protein
VVFFRVAAVARRWIGVVALCVAAASVPVGCKGPADGEPPANDGSAGSAGDAGPSAWIAGACGSCVAAECSSSRAACESDAECAAFLGCLHACPITASGDVEPACEAACPTPASASGSELYEAFSDCRRDADCPCTGDAGPGCPHPLLCQNCPGSSTNPDACVACLQNGCCESIASCAGSSACVAIQTCLAACPSSPVGAYWDCELACAEQHPEGYLLIRALFACIPYHCATECVPQAATCLVCLNEYCAKPRTECFYDVECAHIIGCVAKCDANDIGCQSACAAQHPAAKPLYDAMIACTSNRCGDQCVSPI